uniref:Uncharacterized protein n=1 Tax=Timema shepardi TaxID=629360 RepID=A0A7R9AS16_TIMSH|nr:unnamed protein product [Timema shepardi]
MKYRRHTRVVVIIIKPGIVILTAHRKAYMGPHPQHHLKSHVVIIDPELQSKYYNKTRISLQLVPKVRQYLYNWHPITTRIPETRKGLHQLRETLRTEWHTDEKHRTEVEQTSRRSTHGTLNDTPMKNIAPRRNKQILHTQHTKRHTDKVHRTEANKQTLHTKAH